MNSQNMEADLFQLTESLAKPPLKIESLLKLLVNSKFSLHVNDLYFTYFYISRTILWVLSAESSLVSKPGHML